MDIEEAMAHAGGLLTHGRTPGWMAEKIRREMPQYIWTWQEGRHKHGICTFCGARMERLDRQTIHPANDTVVRRTRLSQAAG